MYLINVTMANWNKLSWRNFPVKQQPIYKELAQLQKVEDTLSSLPGLVSVEEIQMLSSKLEQVCEGKAFLLQGGDCAESFSGCNEQNLQAYFKIMLQMNFALMHASQMPVIKVGRIAGQYAKPRSSDTENVDGQELPSYRGDMVNNIKTDPESRKPDPDNMIKAYYHAAVTLNYLRSLACGGYSKLSNIQNWNNDFLKQTKHFSRFEKVIQDINKTLHFIESCGINSSNLKQLAEAEFFTSHEALILPYEQSLTRLDEATEQFYCTSAHMIWIGERTRNIDEAHIEFARGVANPVGVKVGPSITEDELLRLVNTLNPNNSKGKLTLISRMGKKKIGQVLPRLIRKTQEYGLNVIWSCDPMHGNTVKANNGLKTRNFDDIIAEVKSFFEIHQAESSYAGGVHLEMTGQDVTECLGGAQNISEPELLKCYKTYCDPRLNASQSIELAFLISEYFLADTKK